jgi:hypothetical protein
MIHGLHSVNIDIDQFYICIDISVKFTVNYPTKYLFEPIYEFLKVLELNRSPITIYYLKHNLIQCIIERSLDIQRFGARLVNISE